MEAEKPITALSWSGREGGDEGLMELQAAGIEGGLKVGELWR